MSETYPNAGPNCEIPAGIYYSVDADNFYNADRRGMGHEFFRKWHPRRYEFPKPSWNATDSPDAGKMVEPAPTDRQSPDWHDTLLVSAALIIHHTKDHQHPVADRLRTIADDIAALTAERDRMRDAYDAGDKWWAVKSEEHGILLSSLTRVRENAIGDYNSMSDVCGGLSVVPVRIVEVKE